MWLCYMTRCLKTIWGNAIFTIVYVRNRVWSQGSHCIPYQAVYGNLPDLLISRVFGCQVSEHIEKSRQRKLSHKYLEGICDGHASGCLAWLVYNSSTRKITRDDNDIFNEDWKPLRHVLGENAHNESETDFANNHSHLNLVSSSKVSDSCVSSTCISENTSSNVAVTYLSY